MTLNNGTATSPGPTAGAARTPGHAGTPAAACGAVFVAQVANALPASLNGLGAGAVFPGSPTALTAVARDVRQRAHAVAVWSGFLSAGAAVSPLIGGMFARVGSWRGSFWVLVGLALISVLLTVTLATESRAPEGLKFDVAGQVTFAPGLILVLYGAVEGPESGWTTLPDMLSLAFSAMFLAAFVVVELGAESPIFDLRLFRNRAFTVSSAAAVIGMLDLDGWQINTAARTHRDHIVAKAPSSCWSSVPS